MFYLLNLSVQSIGVYFQYFISSSTFTGAILQKGNYPGSKKEEIEWMYKNTVFYCKFSKKFFKVSLYIFFCKYFSTSYCKINCFCEVKIKSSAKESPETVTVTQQSITEFWMLFCYPVLYLLVSFKMLLSLIFLKKSA